MRAGNVSDLTGCPFADAKAAGLWLSPRLRCGPARIDAGRLIWDPSQPVRVQAQELAEQTAKWRARKGLHIVRTPIQPKGAHDDAETTDVRIRAVRDVDVDDAGTSRSQRLRTSTAPTDPADWVQNDAPGVQLRSPGKLPLGV